jgi:hypothetical protein
VFNRTAVAAPLSAGRTLVFNRTAVAAPLS